MMTSVTFSSTSGPLHGGYSSVAEETTSSEPEFETPRPVKRCLIAPLNDSCKKRRKQSTPVRISAAESDMTIPLEGKPSPSSPGPDLQCPVCQLYFNNTEQVHNHIASDHSAVDCKKEPEDFSLTTNQLERSETPLELTTGRSDASPWLNEIQNKDWMNSNIHGLSFNPTNSMFMALPQFTQHDNMPRQPIRIFNPDAYCDLCNKEFCNKYFLKTHKANKHGIYSDPPVSTDSLVNNVNIASYSGTIKLPTSVPSIELSPIKSESKSSGNIINPFSDIFSNPFSNKLFHKINKSNIITSNNTITTSVYESEINENVPNSNGFSSNSESDKILTDDQPTEESSSPRDIQTESTSFKNDSEGLSYIPLNKMSPGSNEIDLSNRLRRIGVMNPKAFCEICCKEYCNKYFLRTHKMKRHGIYIPDDKDIKMDSGCISMQHNMQTSPLNLIMTEQSNFDRKTTSPSDISCDICGIKFQNISLSHLHNASVHSKYLKDNQEQLTINESIHLTYLDEQKKSFSEIISTNNSFTNNIITSVITNTSTTTTTTTTTGSTSIPTSIITTASTTSSPTTTCSINIINTTNSVTTSSNTIINNTSNNHQLINTNNEKSLNAEAISEDLQKLQTMILQLNELDVTKISCICNACNKEFENRYYLHAHMMTEHGILLDDIVTEIEKPLETIDNNSNNNTMCDLCGKDIQNIEEMKKHVIEFHSNHTIINNTDNIKDEYINNGFLSTTPDKNITNKITNAPSGQINERRISLNVTPTSSYCDICNKELCNKYFMKTHMQRMHGIEIENGAQIGGVICDICNKELCSKYFLRVHKHNTHGIVEYGTSLLPPRKPDNEMTPPQLSTTTENNDTTTTLKPADLADLSHRYYTHFTEVCTICSRRFRSLKWLKAHYLSDHGQIGAEKWAELEQQTIVNQQTSQQSKQTSCQIKTERGSPTLKIPNGGQDNQAKVGIQSVLSSLFGVDESNAKTYQCSFCPFTTTLLPLLFVHERSHSIQPSSEGGNETVASFKCLVCTQSYTQAELLQHHMFTQHPLLPLPPFFNGTNNNNTDNVGETSKEPSESAEDECKGEENLSSSSLDKNKQGSKLLLKKINKGKNNKRFELSPEIGQSLKDIAKRTQVPATYALPQTGQVGINEDVSAPGYVMQAFLLEESNVERRVVPAIVFLPVLQKQPAPLTVTFTLTPA